MMTLTATATEKVQDFIQEHSAESEAGLRVAVLPGGLLRIPVRPQH
ncbi:MAG: hypothetical protein Ct9H300mP15_08390 [Gemmatimonadota bacterium]|nr:MAG: hypothetical protein Ct9H300mP15_08390 [Gemmatimonadota bacterium]